MCFWRSKQRRTVFTLIRQAAPDPPSTNDAIYLSIGTDAILLPLLWPWIKYPRDFITQVYVLGTTWGGGGSKNRSPRKRGGSTKKNTFPTKISYHQLIGTCREMCDAFPIESVFKSGSCHGASSCGGRPETGSRAE